MATIILAVPSAREKEDVRKKKDGVKKLPGCQSVLGTGPIFRCISPLDRPSGLRADGYSAPPALKTSKGRALQVHVAIKRSISEVSRLALQHFYLAEGWEETWAPVKACRIEAPALVHVKPASRPRD